LSGFQGLIPELRPYAEGLYQVAVEYGLGPRLTSTRRTFAEQSELYRRYLRGESPFPAAAPGRSLHNFGHAFDLVVADADAQRWLGLVWESWGGRWGGRFGDPIHFDTGARI